MTYIFNDTELLDVFVVLEKINETFEGRFESPASFKNHLCVVMEQEIGDREGYIALYGFVVTTYRMEDGLHVKLSLSPYFVAKYLKVGSGRP